MFETDLNNSHIVSFSMYYTSSHIFDNLHYITVTKEVTQMTNYKQQFKQNSPSENLMSARKMATNG